MFPHCDKNRGFKTVRLVELFAWRPLAMLAGGLFHFVHMKVHDLWRRPALVGSLRFVEGMPTFDYAAM